MVTQLVENLLQIAKRSSGESWPVKRPFISLVTQSRCSRSTCGLFLLKHSNGRLNIRLLRVKRLGASISCFFVLDFGFCLIKQVCLKTATTVTTLGRKQVVSTRQSATSGRRVMHARWCSEGRAGSQRYTKMQLSGNRPFWVFHNKRAHGDRR